jgi:hypothetical protein
MSKKNFHNPLVTPEVDLNKLRKNASQVPPQIPRESVKNPVAALIGLDAPKKETSPVGAGDDQERLGSGNNISSSIIAENAVDGNHSVEENTVKKDETVLDPGSVQLSPEILNLLMKQMQAQGLIKQEVVTLVQSDSVSVTPTDSKIISNDQLQFLAETIIGTIGSKTNIEIDEESTRLSLARVEAFINHYTKKRPDRKMVINYAIQVLDALMTGSLSDMYVKELEPLHNRRRLTSFEIKQALENVKL